MPDNTCKAIIENMCAITDTMRVRVIAIIFALLVSLAPTSQAGQPESLTDVGSVFGGLHVDANSSGNVTNDLSSLPAIAEDYTATWCTNCVKVEHALNDVNENRSMQQYHFHRFIGENEDPLGSQETDDRWIERYENRLPPTVVFNGTLRQIGSTPAGESLVEDYTANLANHLDLGQGSSTLGWNPVEDSSSGTVVWNLIIEPSMIPENGSIQSSLWIVEKLAYFPDGGNQEEYYHDSVRTIITLGDALSGTMDITLPAAYDNDDLEIHLIHEMILPEPEEVEEEEESSEDDEAVEVIEDSMPALGGLAILSAIGMAALIAQRRQR